MRVLHQRRRRRASPALARVLQRHAVAALARVLRRHAGPSNLAAMGAEARRLAPLLALVIAAASCRPQKPAAPGDAAAPEPVAAAHSVAAKSSGSASSGSGAQPNAGGQGTDASASGTAGSGSDEVVADGEATSVPPASTSPVAPTDTPDEPMTTAPATTHAGVVTAPPTTSPPKPSTVVKVVTTSGFDNNLRVKNLTQLRAALDACVGKNMTTVVASMHLPLDGTVPPADADGRFPFLTASKYPAGTDILSAEGVFLLDPARGERFGADADALSAPYLRSLETVANVVAHNCAATAPGCACNTKTAAHKLVLRCLPAFAPTAAAFKTAEDALAQTCAGGDAGMRKAIASLLASYAFAAKN